MEFIQGASGAPSPVGPYSQAVCVGDIVYCAGQIGLDPVTTTMVSDDVGIQARQVVDNLSAVLRHAGSDWSCVIMATVFLSDIKDGPVVNSIYSTVVNKEFPPARQTVAVKDLPLGAKVEISVIAKKCS